MKNQNCLNGYTCPECGSLEPFWIKATIYADVLMTDNGTEETKNTETVWEDNSNFRCTACGFSGEAVEFQLPCNV